MIFSRICNDVIFHLMVSKTKLWKRSDSELQNLPKDRHIRGHWVGSALGSEAQSHHSLWSEHFGNLGDLRQNFERKHLLRKPGKGLAFRSPRPKRKS
jgi:hypothetical protein